MEPNRIELYSPLSPAECVSRLSVAIDRQYSALFSISALFGSKPVLGRVTESTLNLHKRIRYRNSFQTFLTATIRAEGSGTVISGEFAMHPFVRVFMAIWFAGVVLIGGALFLGSVFSFISRTAQHQDNAWLGVIVLPVMLAFGFGLVRFGRYLARDESRFLTDFLIQVLGANERR